MRIAIGIRGRNAIDWNSNSMTVIRDDPDRTLPNLVYSLALTGTLPVDGPPPVTFSHLNRLKQMESVTEGFMFDFIG